MTETFTAEDSKKAFARQLTFLTVGEFLVVGLTCAIFFALGKFDMKVLWGGVLGMALAIGNFAVMAFFLTLASKKAVSGDVKGGQSVSSMSMIGRYLLLALVLFIVARTKIVNAIALVVPLALFRVILSVEELISTKEEKAV